MLSPITGLCTERKQVKPFLIAVLSFLMLSATRLPAQSQEQPTLRTSNDVFAEIGRRVPAFGGMFVDEENDTLYVYLVPGQVGDVPQVDQAITDVFGAARPPEHQLEVLEGRYTFLQLNGWLYRMTPRVLGMGGVVFISTHDSKNRLRIGVETLAPVPAVEAELAALGVPREAVEIEQSPRDEFPEALPDQDFLAWNLEPLDDCKGLQDFCRPLVGGLQIEFFWTTLGKHIGTCTLGFIAVREQAPGFVTARHCAIEHDHPEENTVYQPKLDQDSQKNLVGTVAVDPKPFPCPKDELRKCRYSDSAFVKEDDNVRSSLGFIARPEVGSKAWDHKSYFRITGRGDMFIVEGKKVTRVGKETGRQEGNITSRCKDEPAQNLLEYLCQIEVKWKRSAEHGDSGAPVITIDPAPQPPPPELNPDITDVNLLGIVWSYMAVSPIWNIEMPKTELGPMKVCDPKIGC